MYEVFDEIDAAPPAIAPTESTTRMRVVFGRVALLVEQVGLGADGDHRAHRVEEVGEQEREDQQDRGDEADLAERAEQVELAEQAEVGDLEHRVGQGGDAEAPGRRG